ncbi:MAG: hypothetical protein CR975_01400 [Gammaproteobacteria bacterium]|nr:MAG: hypothetical protein CR975_01400 [Gammaproteobacteria bacterium]
MTTALHYQQWLTDCLQRQQANIHCHTLPDGEVVWVRRAGRRNSIWRYRLLSVLTGLSGADALKPVPSLGGQAAIANEAAALKRLSQNDIIVPKLLAVNDTALMMSHLPGDQTLMDVLSQATTQATVLEHWQRGATAIVDLHKKNQHVSQCFARNMMCCDDGRIGFIDFEDAPEKVLTLRQCQIRDWLCYLHSTTFLLDNDNSRQQAIIVLYQALGEKTDGVIADIYGNTRRFIWARHLQSRRWGRDALRVAALMRFVQQLYCG